MYANKVKLKQALQKEKHKKIVGIEKFNVGRLTN